MKSPLDAALRASYVTVCWSTLSGTAAVFVAVRTGSLSLAGLGVGVLIDVISSVVLVWRFRLERSGGRAHHTAERRAHFVAATGLLLLGVSLIVTGVQHLVADIAADASTAGLLLSAASLAVLPPLALWKYRIAAALPSRALRTDAHITVVGATTAAVALVALALTRGPGWDFADPVGAIVIGALALNEGRKALSEWRREVPVAT